MATLPAVVLEAPLIDTLLIFTFSSALADADVIAGMIDEVEAASGGRLFCVSLDIDGNENTLHCEDLAGPMHATHGTRPEVYDAIPGPASSKTVFLDDNFICPLDFEGLFG